ncbi:MAG: hypothetical protein JXQ73_08340 [Phycisphaerae bacterium]|nr:hypothetical protein [Phycisphaerae bacterium]
MTSKERMRRAMSLGEPDRVPVMCQLALGHYFLHSGLDPFDVWFTNEGFAEALIRMRERYRFDGILVNLPARPPGIRSYVDYIETGSSEDVVHWQNGGRTRLPHDDNAHYVPPEGRSTRPGYRDIDPGRLVYVEPWDVTGVGYPHLWDFEAGPRPDDDFFPPYCTDTIEAVVGRVGDEVSVHSEVFSPFSQWLELVGNEEGAISLIDDPDKVHACLDRLTAGAIQLARRQIACGVEAVLISSAFAGAGFISRAHYAEFVLPYERRLADAIKAGGSVFVYTHTCGAIGDRLDLMVETGTQGIDTLDPPPLGTVELDKAKAQLAGKVFIKGNIDAVNTLLTGSYDRFVEDVRWRLRVGKPGGGYILSSACSVAPHVEPERLEALARLAEEEGTY